MDIKQIRTFLHVAELGSFTRAAERLRIAQPALGRQVRLLEEELNARLFVRHGRGVALTGAGRTLLERAGDILRQLDQAREAVAAAGEGLSGQVVIGLPPTVSEVLAVPLAERLQSAFPDVSLRLVAGLSGFLAEWLQGGRMDLAVLYALPPSRQLKAVGLLDETLFLVGRPGGRGPVTLAEAAGLPLVLPSPAHGLRRLVEQAAGAAGVRLDIRLEADSLRILKALVLAGRGWTVLPLPPVHAEVASGALTARPFAGAGLSRRLDLAMPIDRPPTGPVTALAQTLRDEARRLVAAGVWAGTPVEP